MKQKLGEQNQAPLLRREFRLASDVSRARLRIVGLGYYEAEINGRPISDAVLDPPPSQYDKTAFSRTHDVTKLLHKGPNAIGVVLGRSYLSTPRTDTDLFGLSRAPWSSEPRLLAQLDVTLRNGETVQVASDDSWRIADGPMRDALYYGEHYDARREKRGWTHPSFDDSSWQPAHEQPAPTASVVPTSTPPVRVQDTFAPKAVTRPRAGGRVYDFGRITAGWAQIAVKGARGATVSLVYGQQLDDDGLVIQPGTVGSQEETHLDTYTLSGRGLEVWEPSFTRHGFRYVQVSYSGRVSSFELKARENYSDVPKTGRFTSSNHLLNRMHDNQRRSLLLNHWGLPTDTSWRDRQAWTADAAVFLEDAMMNFGVKGFYEDWLRTFRDAQLPDGSLPPIAPNAGGLPLYNDPSWAGTMILDAWAHYQHYGDEGVLDENYASMSRWIDLMDSKIIDTGDLYQGFSFGDWSSPGVEADNNGNLAPPEGTDITRNAHLYQEARTLAQIARTLGNPGDASKYDAMADRIGVAFNNAYFDASEAVYKTPTQQEYRQTSNLMPLALDLVPRGEEERVFTNLVRDLRERGFNLNTGAIGTKLLLPVLTEYGRGDLAYRVATQTDYPSWGSWVKQGATTSWEVWSIGGPGQALDHAFLGTFDAWLYTGLAGIQATSPGYKTVRVDPVVPSGLHSASGSIMTPHGRISSSWSKRNGRLTLVVTVPRGVRAQLQVPAIAGKVEIKAGRGRLHHTTPYGPVYSLRAGRSVITAE